MNRFLSWIRVLRFHYSRITRVLSTSCGSSGEPAVFAHFWLRQCRMVLRPHLYCLPSRFTIVRYLYWVLGLCGIWSGVFCSVCADYVVDSSAGSCDYLAQGCRGGGFFPNSAVFALILGNSVLAYGILALPLLFLGYAYCVAFFGSVCLSSAYIYPAVAGLVGFSCGPPSLVVCVCVWGSF